MRTIFRHFKPFAGMTALSVILIFLYSFSELMLPNYMSKIINQGVIPGDIPFIVRTGGVMLGISLFAAIVNVSAGYCSSKVSAGLGRSLRSQVFRRVESFSLAEIDRFGTASLITRTTNDISQIQTFAVMMLRIVVMAPFMAVGGAVLAYSKSPELSNVIFAAIPVLLVLVVLIARVAMPLSKVMQRRIDRVNLVMREKLTGLRVIRAFGTEEYEEQRFDVANTDLTKTALKMNRIFSLMFPGMMIAINLASIGIVWFGGVQVSYGNIQVGDIMAMVQYLMHIMIAFAMLSFVFVHLPRAAAAAERVDEILNTQCSIRDEVPQSVKLKGRGALEFRTVSFCYPGAETPAVQNISFKANPGETVAIIGSTGSGKTTILNLIPRLYDVTEGEILLDGVDIRKMPLAQLRSKLGFVPQKSILFRGDITSNLLWGKRDASQVEISDAVRIAQAQEFVDSTEEGYASSVSQGGSNFSGGQKQRLAIARAVVRRPELYVFDDSFSALDFATDVKLRQALAKETGGATVLIVAQRVSTIMKADRIIVLNNGTIAGIGTHRELYESCGVYQEIVSSQMSAEEVAQ